MKYLKTSLVLSVLFLFFIACNQNKPTNTNSVGNSAIVAANNSAAVQPTVGATDELASTGKIYSENCVRCHKEDGTGGKVEIEGTTINAENFTADKMKNMTDVKYIGYIENGVPDEGMPAFKGKLTDDEIKNLVKFIRSEFQGK